MQDRFDSAFKALPLVAILRGVTPQEVESIALGLYGAGFRLIEVPLNSPRAIDSIAVLARCLPLDAVFGAGTVLSTASVDQVQRAGGQLVVMPHSDLRVIEHAKSSGLLCVPGAVTPTEVFACVAAGADAVKLFPAELVTPQVLKAMRAVLPSTLRLLPVGGITPQAMAAYRRAGASGFGLGGALYTPGMTAQAVVERANSFVQAWCGDSV